jgi:Flp pilus assembly protein protease CpaA
MSQSITEWLMHGCMGVVGLWLCVIDLREHRLPNRLTGSLCAALMTLALMNPGIVDDAATREETIRIR